MGWHLDGRVSAMVGTHTHIPTADTRILPGGTAYQTDAGMTGPYHSVIGVEKQLILERFLTQLPVRMEAARHGAELHGVIVEVDEASGKADSIRRVEIVGLSREFTRMNHTWLPDQPPWKVKTPWAAPSKNQRLPGHFRPPNALRLIEAADFDKLQSLAGLRHTRYPLAWLGIPRAAAFICSA